MFEPSVRSKPLTLQRDAADAGRQVKVLLAAPRGFCAGVHRAIQAVIDALQLHGPPVYVRRPIVHNLAVVRELEAKGAIFVEELDQVPHGCPVVFSAHGVAPTVAEDARRRGLTFYDAVCPLVAKVHREVERHERGGRKVVIIGHKGHAEIEGTLGHVGPGTAFMVNSIDDVAALPLEAGTPAAYAVQTTYSVQDAAEIVAALRERFSDLVGPPSSDICYATTNRQAAVRDIASRVDAVIVAGERFSSNATRLAEVAGTLCDSVQLIADSSEISWDALVGARSIGITAAASTPESSVDGILTALRRRYRIEVEEVEAAQENRIFKRLAMA